jgi:hypothetical protein
MFATYPNTFNYVNDFRVATLLHATKLKEQMTAAMDAFAAQGGTFFSQYEIAGRGSVWPCIQPDIWGTQSGEFAAIKAYNGR